MRLIHCTQKLLKELDVTPVDLTSYTRDSEGLGNWYAHLIRIDKRKCILFTNEKTLYSFLIPQVVKSNLINIKNEFIAHLVFNLQKDGFGIDVINMVRQEYGEIGFARTANRSVIGSMNEFAFEYKFLIMRDGGIENTKILEVNTKINQIPMKHNSKYLFPKEALKILIEGKSEHSTGN